jgi:GH24 family phage-related lysozyme (muramidase)
MALITSTNPRLFDFVTAGEGRKEWIYYDDRGFLTVGIGHMLAGRRDATREEQLDDLRFIHARVGFFIGGTRATDGQIVARLTGLLKTPAGSRTGHRAEHWRTVPPGTPQVELTASGMIALKHYDLNRYIRGVSMAGGWPGNAMASLPEAAQIVIVDIAFNAGPPALRSRSNFATFRAAIDARDFSAAAAIVGRGDLRISTANRNQRRATLLRAAATR